MTKTKGENMMMDGVQHIPYIYCSIRPYCRRIIVGLKLERDGA